MKLSRRLQERQTQEVANPDDVKQDEGSEKSEEKTSEKPEEKKDESVKAIGRYCHQGKRSHDQDRAKPR